MRLNRDFVLWRFPLIIMIFYSAISSSFAFKRYIFPSASPIFNGSVSRTFSNEWRPSTGPALNKVETQATMPPYQNSFGDYQAATYNLPENLNTATETNSEEEYNRRVKSGIDGMSDHSGSMSHSTEQLNSHMPPVTIDTSHSSHFPSNPTEGFITLAAGDHDQPFVSAHMQNSDYGYPTHSAGDHSHSTHHFPEEPFEVEDKVFSKTVVGMKALKMGKLIFTLFMVLIVFVLAALGKLGVSLSPVVLPLALLPVGIIALLLFVPLFIFFVPLVATGLAGGERRKRKKRNLVAFRYPTESEDRLMLLQETLNQVIQKFHMLDEEGLEN